MKNKFRNLIYVFSISLIILLGLGQISANSQSGAFCAGNCAGGCGVSGFNWASCSSYACSCVCVATLGQENFTFVTNCVGLGGWHQK